MFLGARDGFEIQARNWQLSWIYSAQTGQPFSVTSNTDLTGTNTTAHPNRIGDGALPASQRYPTHWFDLMAFVVSACPCFGNSGRNIPRGPRLIDLDLGIMREVAFHERFRLQFRAESFNLMNHPNFGLPNMAIGNQQAGIIGTVVNPERQNQLAMCTLRPHSPKTLRLALLDHGSRQIRIHWKCK